MAPLRVSSAGREDEAQLHRLTEQRPSGGRLLLELRRRPSFFDALEVEGRDVRVVIASDDRAERPAGIGILSWKPASVNGETRPVGYLSSLRIDAAYRGSRALVRGFRLAQQLSLELPARLYLTTILEENVGARRILDSGRAGLPRYRPLGSYYTYSWSAKGNPWPRPAQRRARLEIRRASEQDVDAIVGFWRRHGPRRQFFPAYSAEDLLSPDGLLRGFATSDLMLAFDRGELVGTLGLWSQLAFRQWLVGGYEGAPARLRPLYNMYARVAGRLELPAPGETLDYRFLSLLCVRDDSPSILHGLLFHAFDSSQDGASPGILSLGIHERDPLLADIRRGRPHELRSRAYVVHWGEGEAEFEGLDDRVPYLELGSL